MSYNTRLCIFGFKRIKSFYHANLIVLHEEIKRRKRCIPRVYEEHAPCVWGTHPCIGKNSVVHFLVPFPYDSPFMTLHLERISYIKEERLCFFMKGVCLQLLRREFNSWELWPRFNCMQKRKFKWYKPMYWLVSRRKHYFWSLLDILPYPIVIRAISTIQEYKLKITWREIFLEIIYVKSYTFFLFQFLSQAYNSHF